jgi:hypothetical protein
MCHGHDAKRLPWVVVIINSQKRGMPSPGTDRVGKHLGVYRDQFEKWMDGLMEWEATEKQCPASILKTAC